MLNINKFFKFIIESDISLLNIAAEVATIWGFIYALPNYFKQMKAQNASSIAAECLKLLPALNRQLIDFLNSINRDINENVKKTLNLLEEIKIRLELLKYEKNINNCIESINLQINILKDHKDNDHEAQIKFFASILGENWRTYKNSKEYLEIMQYISLKKVLKRIYESPKNNWGTDSLIFIVITLLIYFINIYYRI